MLIDTPSQRKPKPRHQNSRNGDTTAALNTESNAGGDVGPIPVYSPPSYDSTMRPGSRSTSMANSDPSHGFVNTEQSAHEIVHHHDLNQPSISSSLDRNSFNPYNQLVLSDPYSTHNGVHTNQQPRATRDMEVAPGGHKNAKGMAYGPDGDREWSYPLCNCTEDMGTCCLACWCPCMVYSQNKVRLEHLIKHDSPEPGRNTGMCASDCVIHAALITLPCAWVLQMGTRASIRTRYRIRGGGWNDCLATLLCSPCQLTQESRELDLEEQSLWGWARTGN